MMAMFIGMLGVEAIHGGTWNVGDNGDDGGCGNDYIIGPDLGNNGHSTKAKIHLCQIPDLPFTNHVSLESYVASFSQYLSCEI